MSTLNHKTYTVNPLNPTGGKDTKHTLAPALIRRFPRRLPQYVAPNLDDTVSTPLHLFGSPSRHNSGKGEVSGHGGIESILQVLTSEGGCVPARA